MALCEKQSSSKRKRTESFANLTKSSLTIAKHLFSKQEYIENNVVLSPLSLQVVLSIIAAGSDGPTQQQILDFLQCESTNDLNSFASHLVSVILKDGTPSGGPCLSFANAVWVEKTLPLHSSFKQIVSSDYKATLSSVDFINNAIKVTKEVNLWAEKKTNGLIKDIISQSAFDNLTKLIFTNALYFKGVWRTSFADLCTRDYNFHLLNGSSIKVPFMSNNVYQFIGAFGDFKVLRLPYKQGEDNRQFSMYIFLPNAKDGLSLLIKNLTSAIELLEHNLPLRKRKLDVFHIPKFKFSFEFEDSHMLKDLGVILPKMVDDSLEGQQLSVLNIIHKSFIEVNEEGTIAAAATSARITRKCISISKGIDFIADHPFLFLIREDSTRTILFVGQVLNPLRE